MAATVEHLDERMRGVEDQSLRNELNLTSHEKECALRYGHINESVAGIRGSVAGIRRDLRRAATGVVTALVAVLAFLVKLVFFS